MDKTRLTAERESVLSNGNKTMLPSDKIFATLTHKGRDIVNLYHDNFNSVADVLKMVYRMSDRCVGIAMLKIRNQTQGWSVSIPLSFGVAMLDKKDINKTTESKWHQLELPFVG